MKTLAPTLLIALAVASSAGANEVQFIALDNSPATRLCIAAATLKPMQLHQAIRHQGLNEKGVVRTIRCNDENIASFAARYNPDALSVQRLSAHAPRGSVTIREYQANEADSQQVIALSGRFD
ncbi:DUF3718 domain-containing protein [Marinobacter hydrocarbonoclasticus]|nr:DUF3718 domain-containing protein [Marinobacter nauticus]